MQEDQQGEKLQKEPFSVGLGKPGKGHPTVYGLFPFSCGLLPLSWLAPFLLLQNCPPITSSVSFLKELHNPLENGVISQYSNNPL